MGSKMSVEQHIDRHHCNQYIFLCWANNARQCMYGFK